MACYLFLFPQTKDAVSTNKNKNQGTFGGSSFNTKRKIEKMQGCSNNSNGGSAMRKGPWMAEEDEILLEYVRKHGPRDWSSIRSKGLLPRTGKSCRLRWVNKLKPDLKTGCKFSQEEERIVIDLQAKFGNKWARIATYLPGRTDNDVKNFWSTRQKRMARQNNNNSHGHTSSSRSKKNHLQLATSSSFAPQPPTFEFQVKCLDIVPYEESSSCNFDCSQNYYVEDRDFRVENFDQSQTSLQSQENMNGPILEPSLVWEHYPHPTSDFLVDFGADDLTFPEPFNCVPYVDFGVGNSKIGSVKMEDDSGIFLDDFPVEMFDELEKSMQQPTSSSAAAAAW